MVKKHQIISLLCLAATAALTGCHNDLLGGGSGKGGTIMPSVTVDSKVDGAPKASAPGKSRAEYSDVTAQDLSLTVTAVDGSSAQTWASVSDFDTNKEFRVGEYIVEAAYGDVETEGFECPAFYGSTNITVREDQETPVTLTASLANSMLTINYTDAFKKYMTDWDATAHASGGDYIFYTGDETRAAYLRPGATAVSVHFVKPDGKEATLEIANYVAEARHHYTLTIDLNGGSGDAVLIVKYDDSLDLEDVEIDLSDELMNAPAPVVNSENVTNGQIFAKIEGADFDDILKFTLIAKGGLKAVTLTTQSASLAAQGWPAEVDLMSADASTKSTLTALGLKAIGLWTNPDKMAQLDLTDVVGHLAKMTTDNTTSFQLVVKDKWGKVSEQFSFAVTLDDLVLNLSKIADGIYGSTELDVAFEYNGNNPAQNVTVQRKNDRGTWDNVAITAVSEGNAARATSKYTLTLAVPELTEDITLRATALNGKVISEPVTIGVVVPEYSLAVIDNDVFATKATVTVDSSVASAVASNAKFYASTDGINYSQVAATANGGNVTVSGLKPATKYWLKANVNADPANACDPVELTTEAAAQLPNASLETSSTSASGSFWTRYEFDGWGTNNTMTTNAGSAYAYVRISGTIPTTDAVSGSAVLLRTCGWGSGNTATGSNGTSGTCKYTDPGLLHLGANRTARPTGYGANDNKTNSCSTGPVTTDDLAPLGISFASRPSSMSFYYKYSPKNSADKGYAEVTLMDADGNVLAAKTLLLAATSSYTLATLQLDYPANAPKAGKIYVKFLSSYSADYIKRTNDNFSGPGFANLSNGTFMGSQLYIDEISLNY